MMIHGQFDTAFGPVAAGMDRAGNLTRLVFMDGWSPDKGPLVGEVRDDLAFAGVKAQIDSYFSGERTGFDLPLAPVGSDFQHEVWALLLTIPAGETRSYGEVARMLGRAGCARAVGRANATNPIGLIVPCHRVIGSDGSLTGYAGGLDLKRRLLAFEQRMACNR